MVTIVQTPGRTAMIDGKEYLFFSGYSYLGMHCIPAFLELVKEGVDRYGLLFPSSRISNTQLDLFAAFEEKLSSITGSGDTVCFSSGFLAGRAVMQLFKDEFVSSPGGTHPAIAGRKHPGDFTEWRQRLATDKIISFDSVNPLSSEVNDVSWLQGCTASTCIIDDSHGTGLLNEGRGVCPSLPKSGEHIVTWSLSKAWNITGGAVSCAKPMAQQLRNSPFYSGSTGIPPAFMYAFLKSEELYATQRGRLYANIAHFRSLTGERFQNNPALPIFILPEGVDDSKLQRDGCIISSFSYPDPDGPGIKRVVLNALHTTEDLERLAASLNAQVQ